MRNPSQIFGECSYRRNGFFATGQLPGSAINSEHSNGTLGTMYSEVNQGAMEIFRFHEVGIKLPGKERILARYEQ